MSTVLWALWVVAFVGLEWAGLADEGDSRYTLTNRVRGVMRSNPLARIICRCAITIGLAWLAWHFLLVDPVTHPGAFTVLTSG